MDTARREVIVTLPAGLHVRPAAAVVKTARRFRSRITITLGSLTADAESIIDLMALGCGPGAAIVIETTGDDAEEAAAALALILAKESLDND